MPLSHDAIVLWLSAAAKTDAPAWLNASTTPLARSSLQTESGLLLSSALALLLASVGAACVTTLSARAEGSRGTPSPAKILGLCVGNGDAGGRSASPIGAAGVSGGGIGVGDGTGGESGVESPPPYLHLRKAS